MIFETAAAISGVRPPVSARNRSVVVPSERSQSAKFSDREVRHWRESVGIVRIANETRDFVGFVGDQRLAEKSVERDIGELHLGAHSLLCRFSRDAGQFVAGARRRCFGHELT
jgi:hypothetical protein